MVTCDIALRRGPITFHNIGELTVVPCAMEGATKLISSKATREEILAVVAITRLRCGNCVMIGLCSMTSENDSENDLPSLKLII